MKLIGGWRRDVTAEESPPAGRVKEDDASPEILCNGSKACVRTSNATFAEAGPRSEAGQEANERSEAIQRGSVSGEAEWAKPAQRLRRTAKTSRTTSAKGPAGLAVDTTGQEGKALGRMEAQDGNFS